MKSFIKQVIRNHKLALFFIILIGVMDVVATLLFVLVSKIIIDVATGSFNGSLFLYAACLIGIILFQLLLDTLDIKLRNITEVKIGNTLRHRVFSHLLYSHWAQLSAYHSGDMLTRIIRDSDDVVKALVSGIPLVIVALLQLCGAFAFLFFLDPILSLILLGIMPFAVLFGKLYLRKMSKYSHLIKESESSINSMVQESLLNQVVVRTFERQEAELQRLGSLQSELHGKVARRTKVSIVSRIIVATGFSGGYATAFIWGAVRLSMGMITFGTLTAFLQLVGRIQRPLYDMMRVLPTIVSAKAAIERILAVTMLDKEKIGEKELLAGELTLKMDGVTFGYDGQTTPILDNFSMVATPGTMTAIVGETGAGKTTLIRLILALISPVKGSITISNDSKGIVVSPDARSNFIYVPQGNTLFSGTIRENLLVGNPDAGDNDLIRVLEIAAASFVFDLPLGLDSPIGEGGRGLSEGQAQRIAIARSLLRPGNILLFDEATSALDSVTESIVVDNLKREMKNKTILFITHHRGLASCCDQICEV